jgi:Tol biopolymer transport system component
MLEWVVMAVRRCLLLASTLLIPALLGACGSGSHQHSQPPPLLSDGTIGVTSSGTLWLLAVDGSSEHQIQFGSDWAGEAALSPDGRRVVFDTTNGIWTGPSAGGQARLVRGLPPALTRPNFDAGWAPDSHSIVFAGEEGIYRTDPSGKGPAQLLFRDESATEPKWSVGGSMIAFVRGSSARPEHHAIWVMGADGSHARFLVRGDNPSFSPDGTRVAFSGAEGVYVIGLSGGAPRLLVRYGYQPVWSPHGVYIAYKRQTKNCGDAGCHERIWIIRSLGGAATMLKPEFFESGDLTWTSTAPPKKTVSISLPN